MNILKNSIAAIIAVAAIGGTLVSHANAKRAAGTWRTVTITSGSVPAMNPGSTQRHPLTAPLPVVSSTSIAVTPDSDCPPVYSPLCAYEVNSNNQITAVYYGQFQG